MSDLKLLGKNARLASKVISNLSSLITSVSILASIKSYNLETDIRSICLTTLLSLF